MLSLLLFSVVFAFLAPRCISEDPGNGNEAVHGNSAASGMFFSPYMDNADNISKAVNMSKVDIFEAVAGVDAYSGYISLSNQSHLFFLLTKAPEKIRDSAPFAALAVRWTPRNLPCGLQFPENGPVGINATGGLFEEKRNPSTARKCHLPRSASRSRTQHNQKLYRSSKLCPYIGGYVWNDRTIYETIPYFFSGVHRPLLLHRR
uniref:Putative serine carboxypeptidase n=1 Tax=Ixodes ricinus TaxID=34613 RepID=V5H6V6_IXORI